MEVGRGAGDDGVETTDENPARVALVQQVTLAYLRHAVGAGSAGWLAARRALAGGGEPHPLGRLESR